MSSRSSASPPRAVSVGIVGINSDWENFYSTALQNLGSRIEVLAIHSTVASRAVPWCRRLDCDFAGSLTEIAERSDIRAVLVFDADWYSKAVVEALGSSGKSILLANSLTAETHQLQELSHHAEHEGFMVVPDLLHRHTPATTRIRELLATRLGAVQRLHFRIVNPAASPDAAPTANTPAPRFLTDPCAIAVDWCHFITGGTPGEFRRLPGNDGRLLTHVSFHLGQRRSEDIPATIELANDLHDAPPSHCRPSVLASCRARIECESGWIELLGTNALRWYSDGAEVEESLGHERSACEVLLDLFARRAVGGLIPLQTIGHAVRAIGWGRRCRHPLTGT